MGRMNGCVAYDGRVLDSLRVALSIIFAATETSTETLPKSNIQQHTTLPGNKYGPQHTTSHTTYDTYLGTE